MNKMKIVTSCGQCVTIVIIRVNVKISIEWDDSISKLNDPNLCDNACDNNSKTLFHISNMGNFQDLSLNSWYLDHSNIRWN